MKWTAVKETGLYKSELFFCADKNSWMQRLVKVKHTTGADYMCIDEDKDRFFIKKGERVYADVIY